MATTRSLLSLRTAARQKADMENSTFISDAELNTYLNQSLFELYDLIVAKYENYFVAPMIQTTTTGTDTMALPDGTNYSGAPKFYKLLGLDLISAGSVVPLERFNFAERNQYSSVSFQILNGRTNLKYQAQGGLVRFIPVPPVGLPMNIWYVPALTTLSADTDTFDGISGWDEYVVIDAAIKMMQKEESDVTVLMMQKQAMQQRIESMAANRDAGNPATVADTNQDWRSPWWNEGGY